VWRLSSPIIVPTIGSVARYQHVIWDWNGTLLDDCDVVVRVMNNLLAARSLPPLAIDRYRRIFDFPVRNYYEALGFDLVAEPFPDLAVEWAAAYGAHWRSGALRSSAMQVLGRFAAAGITQSVLSAAEQSLLDEQVAHFGVDSLVDALVGIDDHHAESKLEHGRRWLAGAAVDPSRTVLIGDTTHDYEVGRELGVGVILLTDGHHARERLEPLGVPLIDSLSSLPELIGAM
jgi:phosphoglycolate phosphatase